MQANHSPAPWSGDTNGDILDPDGILIASVYDNPDDGTAPLGEETSDFNQALIRSAPDLLAALERLIAAPDVNLDTLEPETIAALAEARASIAKAKGEA